MWNLVLVRSEMVSASVQDRCTVSTKCTIWLEIILDAPDGILGYVGHVESCFGPFGDGVSVGARYVHGLRHTYHWLIYRFGRSRWYSKVMRLMWNISFQ